jgi:hypothetical protein
MNFPALYLAVLLAFPLGCLSVSATLAASISQGTAVDTETGYTDQYPYRDLELVDQGETPYFILKPGYQLVLEGPEHGRTVTLVISVLDETRKMLIPEIGWVTTRVIEEKEWKDGLPKETARTFFAIDKKTNNVYDFGDETDIYNEDGTEVVSKEGGWLAGQPDDNGLAEAGIFMPGTFLLGAKYYQQLAEGLSMERAENVAMGLTMETPAGTFANCIKVRETNWSEPAGAETVKSHAPGIGLIGEDDLVLIAFGYDIFDRDLGTLKPRLMPEIRPMKSTSATTARAATESAMGATISEGEARGIAMKAVSGEVMEVAVERKLGAKRFVVEIIAAADGAETDVIIDMETGKVLAIEK